MVSDQRLGQTGKFPHGKLTKDDEGELRMALHVCKGNLIMEFGTPVCWIAFSAQQARLLAGSLNTKADELDAGRQKEDKNNGKC